MITKKHYQDALDVQDACNLSGVVFAFAKVMQDICDEAIREGYDTEWKNTHPLVLLWVDKMVDLSRHSFTALSKAYDVVQAEIAK